MKTGHVQRKLPMHAPKKQSNLLSSVQLNMHLCQPLVYHQRFRGYWCRKGSSTLACLVLPTHYHLLASPATTTSSTKGRLQSRTVNDLVVNDELPSTVVNDKSSNTATTIIESTTDLVVEITLVHDRETLLDISSLSHADNRTALLHIENTVLLVDRSEHALDDD